MRKAYILLFLGVWTAILSYLGFPQSWKDILFTLTGFGIMFFSYVFYKEYQKSASQEKVFDNFQENTDWNEKYSELENGDEFTR